MKLTKKLPPLPVRIVALLLALFLLLFLAVLFVNLGMVFGNQGDILKPDDLDGKGPFDCIIVLGCGVKPDGTPTHMLYDRIKTACELYLGGKAQKILMSGDHGQANYDEVNVMKRVAVEEFGVPSQDIFMDHAGFSTYDTMARAANIFGVKKAIVVTQEYHLYRALSLAEAFDIEAYGVSASLRGYSGQILRDVREVAARCKDLFTGIFKPSYTEGDPIDITGNGDVTNDIHESSDSLKIQ